METKVEKTELEIRLEEETPNFLKKYKNLILSVIEDYIYIPNFLWRYDYIYEQFEKSLEDLEMWDDILKEIDSVKNIARDIADWKYEARFWKLWDELFAKTIKWNS